MNPVKSTRNLLSSVTVLGAILATTAPVAAQDLIITIEHVRALDKIDLGGGADFFAQVTIDGKVTRTKPVKKAVDIRPNWVITAPITKEVTDVKIEILDKDVLSKSDLIDINRLDGKRDLDFTVRTRPCRVEGFAQFYDCSGRGVTIVRGGNEKRSAEITFKVDTKRR